MPLFTECQVIYQALFTDIQLLFPSAPREAGHHRAYTHIHTLGRKRNASLSSTTLCKIAVPLPDLALVCGPCPALCFSIRLPTTSWYIFVSCMSTIYEGKDFFFCLPSLPKPYHLKQYIPLIQGSVSWQNHYPQFINQESKSQMSEPILWCATAVMRLYQD